jgi:hypothetical protein
MVYLGKAEIGTGLWIYLSKWPDSHPLFVTLPFQTGMVARRRSLSVSINTFDVRTPQGGSEAVDQCVWEAGKFWPRTRQQPRIRFRCEAQTPSGILLPDAFHILLMIGASRATRPQGTSVASRHATIIAGLSEVVRFHKGTAPWGLWAKYHQ